MIASMKYWNRKRQWLHIKREKTAYEGEDLFGLGERK